MLALSLRGETEEFAEINNLLDFAGQLAEAVFSGPDSANSLVVRMCDRRFSWAVPRRLQPQVLSLALSK